jgi:hypothetical protein
MMELHEIEELFKTVNRNAIRAFLRNAAVLKDPAATPEMKAQAAQNVKVISATGSAAKIRSKTQLAEITGQPIPPRAKPQKQNSQAAAPEQATQLVQQPAPRTPEAAAPSQQLEALPYHPDYAQYGVDENAWKGAPPEAHHELVAHHTKAQAAPPAVAPVMTPPPGAGTAVAASTPVKVMKSVDKLYDLFSTLKKNL